MALDSNYMQKLFARRAVAALFASVLLLAGCGGGGGGGSPLAPPSSTYGPSSDYAGICTLEGQKRFVRSYLDEVYLWYDEIPQVDASAYDNIPDYFDALLVRTPDASGLPKDRFSAVLPLSSAQAVLDQSFAPAAPDPGDGVLKAHTDAVPVSRIVISPEGRRTGYIRFDDHEIGAQDDLITAFRAIRDAGAQDLVLDLRANSGGYLYIALAAASMVTGPSSQGKVFEQLRYNDKRSVETASSTLLFSSQLQFAESEYPRDTALPQLDLPRLYVLASGRTCSSSESIINGLRGIDVRVILVGSTTCGKPYGFRQRNNCDYAFFPIEFKGANAKGFGDYTTGFRPTCPVQDDPAAAAGSAQDPLLNAALFHIDNGSCPAAAPQQSAQSSGTPGASSQQPARPAWAGRLLLPGQ